MSTLAIESLIENTREAFNLPVTPRGRMLHTLDWYMNGRRTVKNYDDPGLTVQDLRDPESTN